jgi:superfamily II DNA helicase RecQ
MIPLEVTSRKKRKRKAKEPKAAKAKGKKMRAEAKPQPQAPAKPQPPPPARPDQLAESLRAWRLEEARRRGVPAFRIFPDRVLTAIAEERPQTTSELLALPGVGLQLVEKYGATIFRLVEKSG